MAGYKESDSSLGKTQRIQKGSGASVAITAVDYWKRKRASYIHKSRKTIFFGYKSYDKRENNNIIFLFRDCFTVTSLICTRQLTNALNCTRYSQALRSDTEIFVIKVTLSLTHNDEREFVTT